jgi:hypothetical protein
MKGILEVGSVILLVSGCVAEGTTTSVVGSASSTSSSSSSASTRSSRSGSSASEASYTPAPSDFHIAVKVRKEECFGSAGCKVTYRIIPTYSGPAVSGTWSVTYEVKGGQDGRQINTFTFDGQQASLGGEEFASTPSSNTKLTAQATDVSEE